MENRIRILFIIFSFDIEAVGGGISRFAVSLAEALDTSIFQIHLCGLWNRGTQVETARIQKLNEAGITAFSCAPWDELHPYRSFVKAYRILRNYLSSNPIDIIHSHSLFGDIAALLLRFEGKAPVILRTLHNELRTEWSRRPLRRILLTNILYPLLFDVEIGVSQFISDGLNGRWLATRLSRRAITIYNAIDIERFRNVDYDRGKIRLELGVAEDAYLVGSVGRLTRQKGYDILLEAATIASKIISPLKIVIIGDGEDSSILRQKVVDWHIENRVTFTGLRSDVDNVLRAFDLFVCSSRWEGLSTVLMEAMAAGIPIVATDIPGNRELLQEGKSAWFVPAEDPAALAQGLVTAYKNPACNDEFSRNARERVNLFQIGRIAKIHGKLYQFVHMNKRASSWHNHKNTDTQINNLINEV